MLVLVVGPSGVGKDTLLIGARAVLAGDKRFRFVRREITRPADAGGEEHDPVDPESFELRREAGAYALWWEAHGLRYGVPSDIVFDLEAGRVVVVNVSRATIARAAGRFAVQVVEVTAPAELVAQRLARRGRESGAELARRLARQVEIPPGVKVERISNDTDPQQAVARLVAVLQRLAGDLTRPAPPVRPG